MLIRNERPGDENAIHSLTLAALPDGGELEFESTHDLLFLVSSIAGQLDELPAMRAAAINLVKEVLTHIRATCGDEVFGED